MTISFLGSGSIAKIWRVDPKEFPAFQQLMNLKLPPMYVFIIESSRGIWLYEMVSKEEILRIQLSELPDRKNIKMTQISSRLLELETSEAITPEIYTIQITQGDLN